MSRRLIQATMMKTRDEEDSDGLFPAVLRARFERQVAVNERLVNFFTEQF